MNNNQLDQNEKINLFKSLFRGRNDCYGEGKGHCTKSELTNAVIKNHLSGKKRIGVYMLVSNNGDKKNDCLYFAVMDFDNPEDALKGTSRLDDAIEYINICKSYGFKAQLEKSKTEGSFHVWHFFNNPISALKVRRLMAQIITDTGIQRYEIFPKQDSTETYGNYINLPLFKTNLPMNTAFLDELNQPYKDQWKYLQEIAQSLKNSPQSIEDIIEINNINLNANGSNTQKDGNEIKEKWITEAMNGTGKGNRTQTLVRLIGYWASKNVPNDVILTLMLNWDKNNNPTLENSYGKNKIPDTVNYVLTQYYNGGTEKDEYKEHTVENKTNKKETFKQILDKYTQELETIINSYENPSTKLKEAEIFVRTITNPKIAGELWKFTTNKLGITANQAKVELKTKSAKELQATEMNDITWIVPGYIPEGLTLLCGKPKMGKSWLVLSLAVAIAAGGRAFGKIDLEEYQGKVLYLALEDNERRLKKRLNTICKNEPFPEDLFLSTEWDKGINGIEGIKLWVEQNKDTAKLIVIDTLASFRAKTIVNQSEYNKDSSDLEPIQKIAGQYGIGIIVIHHLRKATSDDDYDTISGTLGLTGKADSNLIFKRTRGEADAILMGTGRDFDEDFEIAMKREANTGWTMMGNAEDFQKTQARQQIFNLFAEMNQPLSPKQIADMLGKNVNTIKYLLSKMRIEGTLGQSEYGKYYKI